MPPGLLAIAAEGELTAENEPIGPQIHHLRLRILDQGAHLGDAAVKKGFGASPTGAHQEVLGIRSCGLGVPFWDGPAQRMSEQDLRRGMDWVADRFYLIRADDEAPTIEWILEAARAAVMRHGIRGLVVDPYNELEHKRPANQTETEYVSQLLGKVKRFAQVHGVHVWFVAHPAKMQRDHSGARPVPELYDIAGSANWVNKADIGLVVHRDPNKDPTRTDIYVRKVRFKSVGKMGVASLRYDRPTGRYFEIEQPAKTGFARACVDD